MITNTNDDKMKDPHTVKITKKTAAELNKLRRGISSYDVVICDLLKCHDVIKCAHCEIRSTCNIKK